MSTTQKIGLLGSTASIFALILALSSPVQSGDQASVTVDGSIEQTVGDNSNVTLNIGTINKGNQESFGNVAIVKQEGDGNKLEFEQGKGANTVRVDQDGNNQDMKFKQGE